MNDLFEGVPLVYSYFFWSSHKMRSVSSTNFLCWAAVRIVVSGDRLARPIWWASQRIRVTVIGDRRCAKNRATIKDWQKLLLSTGHLLVPELKMTAILFLPLLIHVNEDVEPAIKI